MNSLTIENSMSLKDKIVNEKKNKQKENIRFFGAIIITNILIYLLSSSPTQTTTTKIENISHPHFTKITLTGSSLLTNESFQKNQDKEVSILNEHGELVIASAYFILKEVNENNDSSNFKLEIKNEDIYQLSIQKNSHFVIVPKGQYKTFKKPILKTTKDLYEINF